MRTDVTHVRMTAAYLCVALAACARVAGIDNIDYAPPDGGSSERPSGAAGPTFSEYPLAFADQIRSLTIGPDNNVWLSDNAARIRKFVPGGTISNFPTTDIVHFIATGPDGLLWFTEGPGASTSDAAAALIGRITTDGVLTEFVVPDSGDAIVSGPDKNLWFGRVGAIGRIDVAGHVLTSFPLVTQGRDPQWMVVGSDGNVWFTDVDHSGSRELTRSVEHISRCTVSGEITEFPLQPDPLSGVLPKPVTISAGADGNIWFTDSTNEAVGRLTPAGTVTMFPLLNTMSGPLWITSSPNGELWLSEVVTSRAGHFRPAAAMEGRALQLDEVFLPVESNPTVMAADQSANVWVAFLSRSTLGVIKR